MDLFITHMILRMLVRAIASTLRVVGPPGQELHELAIACMHYSQLIDVIVDRSCE